MDLIADTTYLVGLWRGQKWATDYAIQNASQSLGLCWIVLGEFWHGAIIAKHDPEEVRDFLDLGVAVLEVSEVIGAYADICANLSGKKSYKSIGQNDLWIAAVAISFGKPILTRNKRHFGLIPGLHVEVLEK